MGTTCGPTDEYGRPKKYIVHAIASLEQTFSLLTRGPRPLSIEGWLFPGVLPARAVPLCELREILLSYRVPQANRDQIVAELVRRARRDPTWMVGLAGVMAPGIKAAMARTGKLCLYVRAEVESEVLSCFIDTALTLDLSRPYIACRLIGPVKNRVRDATRREESAHGRIGGPSFPKVPPPPAQHPELVLAKAVRAGVITGAEAELIASTRLEGDSMPERAKLHGCTHPALLKRRQRAERRLTDWLSDAGWNHRSMRARCGKAKKIVPGCPLTPRR